MCPLLAASKCTRRLKSLGVPAQFVVYPDQHHGLAVPSYQKDQTTTRYLDWFNKYLKADKMKEKLPVRK
ncbi:MAG: prolyl oligopeptidase family serine peptidase [Cytophagales bacterium]|nr:prolyl oligopeptidase family serine peptidase [Cytophagales bacterium]